MQSIRTVAKFVSLFTLTAASALLIPSIVVGCGSSDESSPSHRETPDAGQDTSVPDASTQDAANDSAADGAHDDAADAAVDTGQDATPDVVEDAGPAVTWHETYGAEGEDYLFAVVSTPDGGYAAAGCTDELGGKAGAWLIKFNGDGSVAWTHTYEGTKSDCIRGLRQTQDGGFILAGHGLAEKGDNQDVLVIKTDAAGKEQWRYLAGTDEDDEAYGVVEDADGNFVIVGDRFVADTVSFDAFALSLDASGKKRWEHDYGGAEHDYFYRIENNPKGGFIAAGNTESKGQGQADVWLVSLDESGTLLWDKTYGGADFDYGYALQPTSDGGWLIGGATYSFSSDIQCDGWLVKTDESGNEQWQHLYGSEAHEYIRDITQASNGDFVFVGQSSMKSTGKIDALAMRVDKHGTVLWDQRYTGDKVDGLYGVAAAQDGGFVMVGYTKSWGSTDEEGWILKTDADGTAPGNPNKLP